MAKPSESITLYGGKAKRFREIQQHIEEERGWEPSNSEVLAVLMSDFDEGTRR